MSSCCAEAAANIFLHRLCVCIWESAVGNGALTRYLGGSVGLSFTVMLTMGFLYFFFLSSSFLNHFSCYIEMGTRTWCLADFTSYHVLLHFHWWQKWNNFLLFKGWMVFRSVYPLHFCRWTLGRCEHCCNERLITAFYISKLLKQKLSSVFIIKMIKGIY